MTDVMRQNAAASDSSTYPAIGRYIEHHCRRPAFILARQEQLAHFAAAD